MRRFFCVFTAIACLASLCSGCAAFDNPIVTASSVSSTTTQSSSSVQGSASQKTDAPVSVTFSFAGDCTFGAINGFSGAGYFPTVYRDSQSLTYPFDRVLDVFASDDLTVLNFEGTLTTQTDEADKLWHFKGDASYAGIFPAASVEAVTLANNHSGDYLEAGYSDTLSAFKASGTAAVCEEKPFVTVINGAETVIIGGCAVTGENTPYTDGVAEKIVFEIELYKKDDNIVIVYMHWGLEYTETPSDWQQTAARAFIDAGADAVVGSHPHIVQGIELYKGRYIVYSLGNFAFGGNCYAAYLETFIFRLTVTLNSQGRSYSTSIIPCFITSSGETGSDGRLRNNFQPVILSESAAEAVKSLILERSAPLACGVSTLDFLK